MVHNKPGSWKTWAFHGEEVFYVGPAPDHYRCVKCYMPKIHSERTNDTVTLIPYSIPIPTPSLKDHVKTTPDRLISLLTHTNTPLGPAIKLTVK